MVKGVITNVRFKVIHSENLENPDAFKYVNTASKTVHLNTSTAHKHGAASIYSYITINSNILKKKNAFGENEISSDVRKNILSLLTPIQLFLVSRSKMEQELICWL